MNAPAKIGYFYGVARNENILWLNIAMDNIVLMQVLKPLADLFDYFSDHILWQPLHDFEQVEDFASWRVL